MKSLGGEPVPLEPLYYIRNARGGGSCFIWWCVDGKGYTANLDKAWKVTKAEAIRICRSRPSEDTAHLASEVDRLSVRHCQELPE